MEDQSWDQFPSFFFDYFKMMRIFVMVVSDRPLT